MFFHPKSRSLMGFVAFVLAVFLSIAAVSGAHAQEKWNVVKDIERLRGEAPSLAAFPDASGVLWMRDLSYRLRADGTMEKSRRFLLLAGQNLIPAWASKTFAVPSEEGASLTVTEASWYNPMTGKKEGSLEVRERKEQGQLFLDVVIPEAASGRVAAIAIEEAYPKRYYLDDVLFLALDLPAWEQRVTVEVPTGKELFWWVDGVGNPSQKQGQGTDRFVWTVMNQQPRSESGLLQEFPPTLIFSLRKGLSSSLLKMEELAQSLRSVKMPEELRASLKGKTVMKAGALVSDYFAASDRLLRGSPRDWVRPVESIPLKGAWTSWEQALIAYNWFSSMGFGVNLYWSTILPVTEDFPGAISLLDRPVLEITPSKGKPFYFYPGQFDEFGRLPMGLGGMTLYRMDAMKNMETKKIPQSSATEHRLIQKWNLAMDEKGMALGKLELFVFGGWTDIFSSGRIPSPHTVTADIRSQIEFRIPGLVLKSPVIRTLPSGYSVQFDVSAPLGIPSGTDVLLRMPGGVPLQLENLIRAQAGDTLSFPFILETKVIISTPDGYKALALPPTSKITDPHVFLEEQIVHWPKKGQLESSIRWVVRVSQVDESIVKGLSQTLDLFLKWTNAAIPLRLQK